MQFLFNLNNDYCSLLPCLLLSLIVLRSDGSLNIVTSNVTHSGQLHSAMFSIHVQTVSSLASSLLNAVALSIPMFLVRQSSPLSPGLQSGSTWLSNIESFIGLLTLLLGSCTLLLMSSQHSYHFTIIPDPFTSSWQHGVYNTDDWPVAESILDLYVLNNRNPSTILYAWIRTITTSSVCTGAIYWTFTNLW